jgi:hypothetical protein
VKDTAETFIANKDKPSFWLLHSLGWMTYVFIFKGYPLSPTNHYMLWFLSFVI